MNLTDAHWLEIGKSSANISKIFNIRFQSIKMLAVWYYTLATLHNMNKAVNSKCLETWGQHGILLHCWWNCPHLQRFWKEIAKKINQMMNYVIPCTPDFVVLVHYLTLQCRNKKEKSLFYWWLPTCPLLLSENQIQASCWILHMKKKWDQFIMGKLADESSPSIKDSYQNLFV